MMSSSDRVVEAWRPSKEVGRRWSSICFAIVGVLGGIEWSGLIMKSRDSGVSALCPKWDRSGSDRKGVLLV